LPLTIRFGVPPPAGTSKMPSGPSAMMKLDAIWPKAWSLLAPAVDRWRGRYDQETLCAIIEADDMRLWVAAESGGIVAAIVTSVTKSPTGLMSCHLEVAGGSDLARMAKCAELIGQWAQSVGCKFLVCQGRKGWEKVLMPVGLKYDSTTLSKEL
jgi:hypothetical protein